MTSALFVSMVLHRPGSAPDMVDVGVAATTVASSGISPDVVDVVDTVVRRGLSMIHRDPKVRAIAIRSARRARARIHRGVHEPHRAFHETAAGKARRRGRPHPHKGSHISHHTR
jgi:hypothetical protein